MNRYKCPACGGNQYTSADTADGCIYCGNKELKKMETLEPKEGEGMREILFRGKRVDNGEWVYGAFIPDATEPTHGDMVTWGFIRYYDKYSSKMVTTEVERETVGQFTGLTDKNGKKIFEGDIIEIGGYKYVIMYGEFDSDVIKKYCEFYECKKHHKGYGLFARCDDNDCIIENNRAMAVIGNIHENPELLKENGQ